MVLFLLIQHISYDKRKEILIRDIIELCEKYRLVLQFGVNGDIILKATENDSMEERSLSYQCLGNVIRSAKRE